MTLPEALKLFCEHGGIQGPLELTVRGIPSTLQVEAMIATTLSNGIWTGEVMDAAFAVRANLQQVTPCNCECHQTGNSAMFHYGDSPTITFDGPHPCGCHRCKHCNIRLRHIGGRTPAVVHQVSCEAFTQGPPRPHIERPTLETVFRQYSLDDVLHVLMRGYLKAPGGFELDIPYCRPFLLDEDFASFASGSPYLGQALGRILDERLNQNSGKD